MAILLGTQSNGETLPVQVNEFGQLVAKGIDGARGPEGPPGTPGVGQLPPDPYEGAILGWEDGQLAWVGGAVALPEGIFGPLTYDSGLLVVPQSADLVNGQQVFMSDNAGNRAYYQTQTSAITNAQQIPVSLEGSVDNDWSGKPDPVYFGSIDNVFGQTGDSKETNSGWWGAYKTGSSGATKTLNLLYYLNTTYTGARKIEVLSKGCKDKKYGQMVANGFSLYTKENTWIELPSPCSYFGLQIFIGGQDPETSVGIGGIRWADTQEPITDPADAGLTGHFTLTFEDSTDFQYFDVGQVVQPGASILSIDVSKSQMEVSGGTWSAGDQGITGRLISGTGSVSMAIENSIVLREDNGEWVNDFYVTAPEQLIAARKAATSAIKRKRN